MTSHRKYLPLALGAAEQGNLSHVNATGQQRADPRHAAIVCLFRCVTEEACILLGGVEHQQPSKCEYVALRYRMDASLFDARSLVASRNPHVNDGDGCAEDTQGSTTGWPVMCRLGSPIDIQWSHIGSAIHGVPSSRYPTDVCLLMADGSAWAPDGQGTRRTVDEGTWSGYHDSSLTNTVYYYLDPRGSTPLQEHVARFWAIPHTCGQDYLQSANTTPIIQAHVAQDHAVIGAAPPTNPISRMATPLDGPGWFGQLDPTSTPCLPIVPHCDATDVTWTQKQAYQQPMCDSFHTMNPPLALSGHHFGFSQVAGTQDGDLQAMAYPGFMMVQSPVIQDQPSNKHIAPAVPKPRPVTTRSAEPLPTAPRPSLKPHVPTKKTAAGTMGCIGRGTRRRFDSEGLAKVNQVRKNGACLRCRLYKLSCDQGQPCAPCQKVDGTTKVHRGPCINPRLDTVQAFRVGRGTHVMCRLVSQPAAQAMPEFVPAMTIEVTWPFSADIVTEPPVVRLELHRFEPAGQYLAEEWTSSDGSSTRMVELPPLACRNTDAASVHIEAFLDECQPLLEKQLSGMLGDTIMKETWLEVLRVRDQYQNDALCKVVRMYTAVLMNTRFPKSVRANIFDVAEEPEPPFFFEGNLLPPQLTYQIQMLIAMGQTKLQKDVIRSLKQLIFSKQRQENWYTVFLITFVLLSSIELMHYNQTTYLHYKRQNSDTNRENVSFVTNHMLTEWEKSADNLAAHYRFVMNGHLLFSRSDHNFHDNMIKQKDYLDGTAIAHVLRMRAEVIRRTAELLEARQTRLRGTERREMWAICELFLADDLGLARQRTS
ncbi:hypothetical protein NLU13_2801 [Sarocladium strictum]|uniref:Zn(2)-C6 fungal-type domain-containing protein n=1 Tax=Sarocladium strictum TaxID=5046 RepID=A0AA39GL54_SARSR|nr:hypothetical protein NLU13_2801 [Sarocladium strictum]